MYKIVIVTSRKDDFREFGNALEMDEKDVSLKWLRTGSDALAAASTAPSDLMVVDDPLEDMDGLTLIRKLLGINAMINTALVSRLSSSAFHEATEGLGILNNLPLVPGALDAQVVLDSLTQVVGPK